MSSPICVCVFPVSSLIAGGGEGSGVLASPEESNCFFCDRSERYAVLFTVPFYFTEFMVAPQTYLWFLFYLLFKRVTFFLKGELVVWGATRGADLLLVTEI